MYPPPSLRFLPALAHSHRVLTEVVLFRTDGTAEALDHTGGEVTVDAGSAVRRTCTVHLPDPALIPRSPADQLSVHGARIRISYGLEHADGLRETVPLGAFRLDEVDGDVDTGPVTLTGSSLEAAIIDDRFIEPRRLGSATSALGGISSLIEETLPDAVILPEVADASVGARTWDQQDDRWEACRELATALGADIGTDADGRFVVRKLPDVDAEHVVWEVAAGEGGALVSAVRGMTRRGVYNSVTAVGENAEEDVPPVTATVQDEDPGSPTYVYGPFGRVPLFYSSPLLTSTHAAAAAAASLLRARRRPNARADLTALPNPCLEPGDVLRVLYGGGERELHQVRALRYDLGTGAMDITTVSGQED